MTDFKNIHPAHAPHSVAALKPFPDVLHVVTVISNPVRYRSRYRHYRTFEKHVADAGAVLWTIEAAFADRPFEVTDADEPRDIQIRTRDELWNKESLMNLAANRLPPDAKYIAFIDADFIFSRQDWAQETIQQLQHYQAVQMFSTVAYLNEDCECIRHRFGYLKAYHMFLAGKFNAFGEANIPPMSGGYYRPGAPWTDCGAPGAAWAFRREALDRLGGLIDVTILGSGDYFMAAALVGMMKRVLPAGYSDGLKRHLLNWQERAERHVRRNVGIVQGTISHLWHGRLSERGYGIREQILVDYQFDPEKDLKRDAHGLYQLDDDGSERFMLMRDKIRAYFRSRNEDGVEE